MLFGYGSGLIQYVRWLPIYVLWACVRGLSAAMGLLCVNIVCRSKNLKVRRKRFRMTPPVCVLFRFEGRGQTRYMGVGHRQSDFVSCILYLVSLLCCLVCIIVY